MKQESPKEVERDFQKEKNLGLVVLALLFVLIFWNTYWFLSKFLLIFIVVYVAYMAKRALF